MTRLLSLLLLLFCATTARAEGMPSVLRVGIIAPQDSACAAPSAATPPGLARFAQHLAGRLQLTVQLCAFRDANAAAAALARGAVDFAPITPAAFPAVQGKARPILTLRAGGGLPRTPIVAAARAPAGPMAPAQIAARRVVLIREGRLAHDAALAVLAGRGGGAIRSAQVPVAGSFGAALTALTSGRADVMLMPIDLWAAGCATGRDVCAPLRVVWKDWPLADSAWCLRLGLPNELRYRLIGIMLPLHIENAAAFAGVAGRRDGAFEPTEATALVAGPHR